MFNVYEKFAKVTKALMPINRAILWALFVIGLFFVLFDVPMPKAYMTIAMYFYFGAVATTIILAIMHMIVGKKLKNGEN